MSNRCGSSFTFSRRSLLKGAAAGAAAAAAGGFPGLVRAKPSQMVIASGGGKIDEALTKAYYQPWSAKTGIRIVSTPNPAAKLQAMVEQKAVEWDVVQIPAELAAMLARKGLLEPLDYSVIDKKSLLPGVAHSHFVLFDVAAYHIAWNTKNLKGETPPQTWKEFWAVSGRRGLWKRPFQTMEAALMADGVDKGRLYPLDVERALRSLAKVKESTLWWDRGAQSAQILIDGEVKVGATWNGRVYEPKLSGAPVDYHFNQAVLVSDAWVVPKGAPNKRESMAFIAMALEAEHQAAFSREIPYGPTNPSALKLLDPALLASLPSSEENLKKGVFLDVDWWADNGDRVGERFNEWILG